MKRNTFKKIFNFWILLFILIILCIWQPARAQIKAEEIIEKSLEVQGGRQLLEKIHDSVVTASAKIYIPTGELLTERVVYTKKNPLRLRVEETVLGMKVILGYDGEKIWMEQMGKVMLMPENLAQAVRASLKREDLLLKCKDKGYKTEYMGETQVEGKKSYQVKITDPDGEETFYCFDAETFLPLKVEYMAPDETGKLVKNEIISLDFKKTENIVVAFKVIGLTDGRKTLETNIQEIKINQGLDDNLFQMPEKK